MNDQEPENKSEINGGFRDWGDLMYGYDDLHHVKIGKGRKTD